MGREGVGVGGGVGQRPAAGLLCLSTTRGVIGLEYTKSKEGLDMA